MSLSPELSVLRNLPRPRSVTHSPSVAASATSAIQEREDLSPPVLLRVPWLAEPATAPAAGAGAFTQRAAVHGLPEFLTPSAAAIDAALSERSAPERPQGRRERDAQAGPSSRPSTPTPLTAGVKADASAISVSGPSVESMTPGIPRPPVPTPVKTPAPTPVQTVPPPTPPIADAAPLSIPPTRPAAVPASSVASIDDRPRVASDMATTQGEVAAQAENRARLWGHLIPELALRWLVSGSSEPRSIGKLDRMGSRLVIGLTIAATITLLFLMTRPDALQSQRIAREEDDSPLQTDTDDRTLELTAESRATAAAPAAAATAMPRTNADVEAESLDAMLPPPATHTSESADNSSPDASESGRDTLGPLGNDSLQGSTQLYWQRDDLGQHGASPSAESDRALPSYPKTDAPGDPIDWRLMAQHVLTESNAMAGLAAPANLLPTAEDPTTSSTSSYRGLRSGPLQLSPVATPPPDWNIPDVPQAVIPPPAPRTASGESLVPQPGPGGQYFYRHSVDAGGLDAIDQQLLDQSLPTQMTPSTGYSETPSLPPADFR